MNSWTTPDPCGPLKHHLKLLIRKAERHPDLFSDDDRRMLTYALLLDKDVRKDILYYKTELKMG